MDRLGWAGADATDQQHCAWVNATEADAASASSFISSTSMTFDADAREGGCWDKVWDAQVAEL